MRLLVDQHLGSVRVARMIMDHGEQRRPGGRTLEAELGHKASRVVAVVGGNLRLGLAAAGSAPAGRAVGDGYSAEAGFHDTEGTLAGIEASVRRG